jgi:hypothetical protein
MGGAAEAETSAPVKSAWIMYLNDPCLLLLLALLIWLLRPAALPGAAPTGAVD